MKPTPELLITYPFLIALVLLPPIITFLFGFLINRRENRKIALDHINVANTILTPTLSTTNKKQIYLTEQLFRNNYRYSFDYDEITALLNCKYLSKAIEQLLRSYKFLTFSSSTKAFEEKQGPWFSILGKSPILTEITILIRYFLFSISGLLLGLEVLKQSLAKYVNASQPIDAYFIPAVLLLLFSTILIIIAFKDMLQTGDKKIAVEFLSDNFPKD